MIDVAFTPAEARPADVTVVIDVLRATSTIVQALHAGYRRVLCADGLDQARALARQGRVLAGERRCVPPPDFELGNSPAGTIPPRGEELVLATTNGTPAIVRARELSPTVLIACLLNLDAAIAAIDAEDVQLLCAGTDGRPALEDAYVAGRIAVRLDGARSDAARIAEAVVGSSASNLAALMSCADAVALDRAGLQADVEWCARESVLATVPRVRDVADGVTCVEDLASPADVTHRFIANYSAK